MATIEEIRNELNDAKERLGEATEKLKKWKEGKYKGKKLEEWEIELIEENLSEAKKTELKERMERLYEEKGKLEEKEGFWRGRVGKLQDALVKFDGGEEEKNHLKDDKADEKMDISSDIDFTKPKEAFSINFQDKQQIVKDFLNYAEFCHEQASYMSDYVPYIAIVQSSGYGKSRLIKEIAREIHTLYLNLGIGQDCFPRPTECAEQIISSFQSSSDPTVWFNNLLEKAMFLIKEKSMSPSELWRQQEDGGRIFWKDVLVAADRNEPIGRFKSEKKTKSSNLHLEQLGNDKYNIKILFCIDEGRKLIEILHNNWNISLFQCWRRALQNSSWRSCGVFSVILDTTSRVSNFAPSKKDDPTLKTLLTYYIFPPFIDICTFNSLAIDEGDPYDITFSRGRPFWKAMKDVYFEERSTIDAWRNVITLARVKLQGGGSVNRNLDVNVRKKNLITMAVIASLCSIDISPQEHFAGDLVASHLGTCIGISTDRTRILVSYPPEPVISEAALQLLEKDLLTDFAETLKQGIVEPGKRGELVGELILLLTRKQVKQRERKNFYMDSVSLTGFLEELLVENIVLKEEIDEHKYFKTAEISFTRFVTIGRVPSYYDLIEAFKTCVAFNLKRNHKGADILIPVKVGTQYTVWLIQIKNHNRPYGDSNIQIGAHKLEIREANWGVGTRLTPDEKPRTHYIVFGLNSFKQGKSCNNELCSLLVAYIDPHHKIWSERVLDTSKSDKTWCRDRQIQSFLPWEGFK
ncbi:4681_t:CDS:2 [Funneliformis caledonium]|uniref:4681_t:CDS:1 n=1 Tax=Funneliformis caledonium TaxID=1117310 RepID=A0A9N9G0W8_9GLOM|nr:4681_t:CDS:2 [Funneliformis caledonium]